MFDIFKNNKKELNKDSNLYVNIGALLIHVAKIDENYSEKEKKIIKKTLLELGLKEDVLDSKDNVYISPLGDLKVLIVEPKLKIYK